MGYPLRNEIARTEALQARYSDKRILWIWWFDKHICARTRDNWKQFEGNKHEMKYFTIVFYIGRSDLQMWVLKKCVHNRQWHRRTGLQYAHQNELTVHEIEEDQYILLMWYKGTSLRTEYRQAVLTLSNTFSQRVCARLYETWKQKMSLLTQARVTHLTNCLLMFACCKLIFVFF